MKKLLLAAAVAFASAVSAAHADQSVTILTGGRAGVYFPLGVAVGRIVAERIPGARPSVQRTEGSAENLRALQVGRGEIAFTLGDALADAWTGNRRAGFKTPLRNLRGIAAIYPNYIQIVARADSRIRRLADLSGKRISVGERSSGTELNARSIFGANRIGYKDFARTDFLPFGASVRLIRDRRLDATLISAGLGVPAIRDLASATPISIVAIEPDEIARISSPVYRPGTIPAGTYGGQGAAVPTVMIRNYLVTRQDLPEKLVYEITRAIFGNLPRLAAAHPAARMIRLDSAIQGMPLPLHPGAAKFYQAQGILK